ncbi:MAG: FAD-binding domain-containing protein [Limnobacter sp.]|nr:FAD-binding domain-containing protein [Limnobacter sp.]
MIQLLWFKRDLRLAQNYALIRAIESAKEKGPVLFLYIHEPELWASPTYSSRHQVFLRQCLDDLRNSIENCGGVLIEKVGSCIEVFSELCAKLPVSRVTAHEEITDSWGYARDKSIRLWLKDHQVEFVEVEQNNIQRGMGLQRPFGDWFELASRAKQRDPRGVDLRRYLVSELPSGIALDEALQNGALPHAVLPHTAPLPCPKAQRGGETQAHAILNRFMNWDSLKAYPYSISSPNRAVNHGSRLSAHLAWGTLSHAQVAKRINDLIAQAHETKRDDVLELESAARFYLDRLQWRQGYHAHTELNPDNDSQEYFAAFKAPDAWPTHTAEYANRLRAFEQGQTGIPLIDACMACLLQTGWLNFRFRSALANFACMGLGLYWKDVGHILARLFVDFDGGAIHWSQMRIASGTGQFDQLLVYSIAKQSREQDKAAQFQKQYLPMLRQVPAEYFHDFWLRPAEELEPFGVALGSHHRGANYPHPIVNPDEATATGKKWVYECRKSGPIPRYTRQT